TRAREADPGRGRFDDQRDRGRHPSPEHERRPRDLTAARAAVGAGRRRRAHRHATERTRRAHGRAGRTRTQGATVSVSAPPTARGVAGQRFPPPPRRFSWPEVSTLRLGTLGWILLIAYLTIGWANTGRTWGKGVLGLRVVSSRDAGLPLWRAFVRATLCALFPIGLFWSAVSSRNEP